MLKAKGSTHFKQVRFMDVISFESESHLLNLDFWIMTPGQPQLGDLLLPAEGQVAPNPNQIDHLSIQYKDSNRRGNHPNT